MSLQNKEQAVLSPVLGKWQGTHAYFSLHSLLLPLSPTPRAPGPVLLLVYPTKHVLLLWGRGSTVWALSWRDEGREQKGCRVSN